MADGKATWARVTFGDDAQAGAARAAVARARAAAIHPITVAPYASVTLADGRVLRPGDEVRPGIDLEQEEINRARHAGVLIVLDARELRERERLVPQAGHTHRVLVTITGPDGMLTPGSFVGATDFDKPERPPEPEQPPLIQFDGRVRPGWPARPGQPAIDGATVLADLERRGLVEPIEHEPRATTAPGGARRRGPDAA